VVGNKSSAVPSEIARGTTYRAILALGSDSGYYKTCADFACNIDFDGSDARVDEFGSVGRGPKSPCAESLVALTPGAGRSAADCGRDSDSRTIVQKRAVSLAH
jgi:hypothetical protein